MDLLLCQYSCIVSNRNYSGRSISVRLQASSMSTHGESSYLAKCIHKTSKMLLQCAAGNGSGLVIPKRFLRRNGACELIYNQS